MRKYTTIALIALSAACSHKTFIAAQLPTAQITFAYPEEWQYRPNLSYRAQGPLEVVAEFARLSDDGKPICQLQILQGAMFFESATEMAETYLDLLATEYPTLRYDLDESEMSGMPAASASYRYEMPGAGVVVGRDLFVVRPAGWCMHATFKSPEQNADVVLDDGKRMLRSIGFTGELSGMHPPMWFVGRGIDLLNNGLPRCAVNALEIALSTDSSMSVAWFHMGRAVLALGDTATGVARVERALEINPGFTDARMTLADVDLAKGDTARAEAAYDDLTRRLPKLSPAWLKLGVIAYARGDYPKSVRLLEKARELSPDNPDVYWHIAGAYEAVGRIDDAIEATGQYLVRDYKSPRADEVRTLRGLLLQRRDRSTQP